MNRSGAAAGIMQSSPVQQMMMATGNPTNWWNLNYSQPLKPPPAAVSSAYPSQNFSSSSSSSSTGYSPDLLVPTSVVPNMNNCNLNLLFQHQNYSSSTSSTSSSSSSPTASSNWPHLDPPPTQQQHLPAAVDSWSQFLANGTTSGQLLSGGTDNHHHHDKATGTGLMNQQFEESNYSTNYQKMENIPVLMQQQAVKQDNNNIINPISNYQGGGGGYHNFYGMMSTNNTTAQLENNHLMMNVIKSNHHNWPSCSHPFAPNSTSTAVASPQSSCVTTTFTGGSNLVDFPHPTTQMAANTSPECKNISVAANTGSGGGAVLKKAKVQQPASSSPSTFKVRKFGDRITALHQMVSPFGKTDTASVLLEAIGYIRFLHSQIEALSIPYLSNGNGSANNTRQLHPHTLTVQGDQKNSLFPEDPGQISNDNCLKRKAACHEQEEPRKDLRSTGLCLIPLSCTALHMGNENGADYWAPSLGGFR